MPEEKPDLDDIRLAHYGVKGMKWGKQLAAPPAPAPRTLVPKKVVAPKKATTTNMAALSKIQKDTSGTIKGKGTPVWKTLFGAGNKATLDYIMEHIGSLKITTPSKTKRLGANTTSRLIKASGKKPVPRVAVKRTVAKPAPKAVVRRA